MYYMGVDLGTSGLKVVICDINSNVLASHNEELNVIIHS